MKILYPMKLIWNQFQHPIKSYELCSLTTIIKNHEKLLILNKQYLHFWSSNLLVSSLFGVMSKFSLMSTENGREREGMGERNGRERRIRNLETKERRQTNFQHHET
jgi:hypothetical protein